MSEPTAGYSLNPTLGASAGLVHTDVPYSRTILTPDGEAGAIVSGAPAMPATAFALNIDYPVAQKGSFIFTPGLQAGGTRWGQYQSWFGSIYNRFGINLGHDYFSPGLRVGYGGFSTHHNGTQTIRHGLDVAGDVICQLSHRVGLQITAGGHIELGGHSQTFVLGGLTVRLGSVSSIDPADLASGVRALGLAQSKYFELEMLFGNIADHLRQFFNLDHSNTDIDTKIGALEQYMEWITQRDDPAFFEKPALAPYFLYIESALQHANKAIPSPHPYKDAEVKKIQRGMAILNTKMAQPALDLLFFMQGSIFDELLKEARNTLKEVSNKDSAKALEMCQGFGKHLYDANLYYEKLKPFMSKDQELKIAAIAQYFKCLQKGDMCPGSADLTLTILHIEGEVRKITSNDAKCRYTNGKGAKK